MSNKYVSRMLFSSNKIYLYQLVLRLAVVKTRQDNEPGVFLTDY